MYTDIVGYTSIANKNDALAQKLNEKHKQTVVEQSVTVSLSHKMSCCFLVLNSLV